MGKFAKCPKDCFQAEPKVVEIFADLQISTSFELWLKDSSGGYAAWNRTEEAEILSSSFGIYLILLTIRRKKQRLGEEWRQTFTRTNL
jgi:hypothetical protein